MSMRRFSIDAAPITAQPPPVTADVEAQEEPRISNRVKLAVYSSALANFALFSAKLFAFIASGSQAILASLADSGVDLASQLVVFICNSKTRRVDRKYPVGKSRLETVGALIIACIMTFAAILVIWNAVEDLATGFRSDDPPVPNMDQGVYAILGSAILLKALLFVCCYLLRTVSDSTLVLAQDHKNDVLSNLVVIIAAAVSVSFNHKYWYVDPIGGIAVSAFIIICWVVLADRQIEKIVGKAAPQDFCDKIKQIAANHERIEEIDSVRAYHLGLRFYVEIDVVMPGSLSLFDSHDSALDLQKKVRQSHQPFVLRSSPLQIESLDEVERAFVHVDYMKRERPEHKLDWSMS